MKKFEPMEKHVFYCDCHSLEHHFVFTLDPESEPDEPFYLDVYLSTYRGFWKRLWYGLKYAFGHQSRFGAWDSTGLDVEQARRLQCLLDRFMTRRDTRGYRSAVCDGAPPLVPSR